MSCSTEHNNEITSLSIDHLGGTKARVSVSCEVGPRQWTGDKWLAQLDSLENIDWKAMLSEYRRNPLKPLEVTVFQQNVTADFLRKLFEVECLRDVHTLGVFGCHFEESAHEEYLKLIAQIQPNTLIFGANPDRNCIIPKEILDHVEEEINYMVSDYNSYSDYSHFNDELLPKWFTPPKRMKLNHCITGFTLSGIENQLKKLREDKTVMKNYKCDFGHLKNVSPDDIRTFLDSFEGIKWNDEHYHPDFEITDFYGESCQIWIRPSTNILPANIF